MREMYKPLGDQSTSIEHALQKIEIREKKVRTNYYILLLHIL